MKICQLIAVDHPSSGGLGKHFLELTGGLSEQVETVAICHPDYQGHLNNRVHHRPLDMSGQSP